MARRLILMRHAKSSWADPTLPDHARPLNRRGQIAATTLGDWLRQSGVLPDEALISPALRTRQTAQRLSLPCPLTCIDKLYLADAEDMLGVLHAAAGGTVLMLGHNPGIAAFAARLATAPPDHPRFADYPTGATLILRFDIARWSEVTWGSGGPEAFVIPRELTG